MNTEEICSARRSIEKVPRCRFCSRSTGIGIWGEYLSFIYCFPLFDSVADVRLEPGATTDAWFTSCVELAQSRFSLDSLAGFGVKKLKVARVFRIHNRYLKTQFEVTGRATSNHCLTIFFFYKNACAKYEDSEEEEGEDGSDAESSGKVLSDITKHYVMFIV